jgi:hypothetical protein
VPLPTANSYLDQADADAYFTGSFNQATWQALDPGEKDAALNEATKWLETLCWAGEKCDPAQPLAWPRTIAATGCCAGADCTAMPAAVVQAIAELALALHQNKTAIIGSGPTPAQLVRRQALGDLEIEFETSGSGTATARYGPNAPTVLQRFPWLGDLLGGCYLIGSYGSARILDRVRS